MVLVLLAAGIALAGSAGVALGVVSVYSPLKLSRRQIQIFGLWVIVGLWLGFMIMPGDRLGEVGSGLSWLVGLGTTIGFFRWRYPKRRQNAQYEFPFS